MIFENSNNYLCISDFLGSPILNNCVNDGIPLHAHLDDKLFSEIINKSEIGDFIFNSRLEKDRVRFVQESTMLDVYNKGKDLKGNLIYKINPKKVDDAMKDGVTCIIESYDEWNENIHKICAQIDVIFKCVSKANLYITWGEKEGFGPHYDNHDVIVFQLFGSKTWTLWLNEDNGRFYGNLTNKGSKEEVQLNPGDILYIPQGHWHNPICRGPSSLHVTISIGNYNVNDYLKWLISEVKNHIGNDICNVNLIDINSEQLMKVIRDKIIIILNKKNNLNDFLSFKSGIHINNSRVNDFHKNNVFNKINSL